MQTQAETQLMRAQARMTRSLWVLLRDQVKEAFQQQQIRERLLAGQKLTFNLTLQVALKAKTS